MRRLLCLCSCLLAAFASPSSVLAADAFDPLGWREHWRVLDVLEASGRLTPQTRFTRIALLLPDKAALLGRSGAAALPRLAEVQIKERTAAIRAVVDVGSGRIVDWRVVPNVQPAWLLEEFLGAPVRAVVEHPDFKAALARRGVTTTRFLNCRAMPIGNHEEPRLKGRRVAMVRCDPVNGLRNTFVRRIEGLVALVDTNTLEVIEISDDEIVPVPKTTADYDAATIPPERRFATPLSLAQPDGPSFSLQGHRVSWDRWRFHVRSDQRLGTIISELAWVEGESSRPVMFEGHLSEIFVPYMDPRRDWYTRTLLDAGEYSMGGLSGSLTPRTDCPSTARYLSGQIVLDNGRPFEKPNVICLFERTSGDMSWRHAEIGRPKRELVVRMVADLGNYDYVFDWIFESDGQFRVAVGATGIVATQMSHAADANAKDAAGVADRYGRFVDRHVVAVNHDHYFNFRLDLDVDGPSNRFIHDELVSERLPEGAPRRSLWVSRERTITRESEGRLRADGHRPTLWRVVSSKRRNANGYPTGYQIVSSHGAHTLLAADDVPRRRAGFIDHDLWVTAYSPLERHAAGDYPVLSAPGEGLPAYSGADRPLVDRDLVIWATLGMQHKVRAEDWPVMPVLWHDLVIRPFDFFDRNPAMTLGPDP